LGVAIEAALAATLLLRGLTFWLPMVPGLWLARREIEPGGTPARSLRVPPLGLPSFGEGFGAIQAWHLKSGSTKFSLIWGRQCAPSTFMRRRPISRASSRT